MYNRIENNTKYIEQKTKKIHRKLLLFARHACSFHGYDNCVTNAGGGDASLQSDGV